MNDPETPRALGARHVMPVLTAFLASGAIMMIELTAGKLVSRFLGSSLYTWTSIIAVIMAGMAVGNALGGRIADRRPPRRALAALFFLAAAACALTLPINTFLGGLGPLAALDWPARIFLHTFGLFFLPAIALGGIVPVVARLALGLGGPEGRTVGLIYAAGVAGSIACTFLTGYWLVSVLPVSQIFTVAACTLAGLGLLHLAWAFLSQDTAPAPRVDAAVHPGLAPFPWWTAIATVTASNFAFMALQLGAARVLARDYGNSIYTWTATIGVFLAGITLGNLLGGWAADRGDPRRGLAKYFLLAGVAALTGPLLFRTVHDWLLDDAAFEWAGWGLRIVLVLGAGFFLPCFFLGFISPLVVKRGLDAGRAPGQTVASVYAWGAVGGVLGTLATGYFLIDLLGSLTVICLVAVLLTVTGGAYAQVRYLHAVAAACAAIAVFAATSPWGPAAKLGDALKVRPKHYDSIIYEDESQYSFIAIRAMDEEHRVREMILDKLAHSEIDYDNPAAFKQEYEWVYNAVIEKFFPAPAPVRSFFIGGGGFIFPRHFDATRPGSHTEVAEIDPAVTRAAYDAFGFTHGEGLRVYNMDARNRVESLLLEQRADPAFQKFDLIIGDSFNDFSVPSHLTTVEFARAVDALLADNGLYLLNMIDMHDPGRFVAAIMHTLESVFPHVYLFNCGAPPNVRDTWVIVCSKLPRGLAEIPAAIAETNPYGGNLFARAAVDALYAAAGRLLLTDDYAPTEILLMPVVRKPPRVDGQDHYLTARQSLDEGYKERALAEGRLALKYHPGWPDGEILVADLLAGQGQVDEALKGYRAALRFAANPAGLHAKIAQVFFDAGRVPEGAAELEKVLELEPANVPALLQLSALRLEQQAVGDAIALLERAVAAEPKNVDARYNLGFAHAALGHYPEAIAQWEAALQDHSAHEDTLRNLLLAYILTKDYTQARGVLQRYVALGKSAPADLVQQLFDAENGITPANPHGESTPHGATNPIPLLP